ncbi:MAG TPA: phosphatidylglycerophosphatase A [Candidatus Limnocylindrales bacterium]|nr:phosphatidylglycerophosphatase A [Candidatus Limnocylindrales bacterium]
MTNPTDALASKRKPRISYFLATACGLGYLKPGPGTWGSLGGVALTLAAISPFSDRFYWLFGPIWRQFPFLIRGGVNEILVLEAAVALLVSLFGVWVSDKVVRFSGIKDPQFVVIDEVSGVMITLILGLGVSFLSLHDAHNPDFVGFGWLFFEKLLNWKYLLAGFILFRVFDIWKPFPARQAESLPGGWGIMADDWVAGIYAALVLWGIQALGWLR